MLLQLLGACAVVGPFQGPEWEPVRDLLSEDHSCRDPRCCGNLLVFCLFLIWQVRHYWHQITKTHLCMKKVIKVPPQKWAVISMRHDTCFGLIPKLSFSPGKFRGLNAHVQQCAQKKRWKYWRSLRESWAQYLLSWRHPCQCSCWDLHTPSEPIFCTTSFSSTCMLPQDSSWDIRQVPCCLSDGHTHPICKPLLPALDMHRRRETLLVHSQEELVPLEPAVSMRSHPTSMTVATSLSNLPSSQRLKYCFTEFLPFPSYQQGGIPTWKSWDFPPEAWAPGRESQALGRKDIRETQTPVWTNQRESSGEDAWEIQASGRQLPINFGMEDNAETEVLEWRSQRLVISKADREILTLGWEIHDQMGLENRSKIQELGKRNQREAVGEDPPATQEHRVENQDQLRCKTDAETQTPEWGDQDKNRNEDAVETQAFKKNKKEAQEEDERETQAQGLGKQSLTGSENGESQTPGWRKQDQIRGDIGTEIQAEKRKNKDQVEGENAVQTQIFGRENLGEVKENDVNIQVLEWGKQECVGSENVTDIQTPWWEKQDRGGSEKTGKTQASREEIQKHLRHELQVESGSKALKRGEDAGATQIYRRKNLREIKEEEWVVVQALWWEDQRPVASEIDREFEIQCWGNQDQIGGEHRAEIQTSEKRNQRKDRGEDDINTLAPEAENQRQLRGETHVDTHPPDRKNQEPFGDEPSTYMHVPAKGNLRGVKNEDGKETQELREEHQGQLSNEINGKIHTPKWKNEKHIRSKDGANTHVPEAEKWGELTSKIDGETHSAKWKKEDQAGGENGTEIQASEKRNQREAGGDNGTETCAPEEEGQSQLRGDIDRKTHLSEWKNQEQMGGETGTEVQAPEKRNQRKPGHEDGTETQKPERENLGELDSEIGVSHSPGRRNWEQTGGKNDAEHQTLEKRNQREGRSEDGRKIQRLRGGNQTPLKRRVNGKTCSSEWKNQEQIGGEDGAEIQIQGKRDLRGSTGGDGRETQAPGGDYQRQLRSQIGGEIQMQGQGNQNKGGDEDAAEIWDVGSQRKCRAEDAGGPGVPRGGNKDRIRGKDAAEDNLQVDCSGGESPLALAGSGYGAMEQEQTVASAPCPEMKPLPHQGELFLLTSGEGKHLASQSTAPARKHRVGVSRAFCQAPPKPPRSRQRDKRVDPGKTSSLAWQLQNPQALAASLNLPSSCPSDSCGQVPQAATVLVGAPTALTVLPKWPVLKKSQRLLLESLMRRKMAHLKWGLPQRILESHLLFNFLGLSPLSFSVVQLPGLYTACDLQWQRERLCEAQGSMPGLKSPERSQRVRPPERKSSKLSTLARALEKCGPRRLEPTGISIPPQKPRRVRPPGGPREQQDVLVEAPLRAKLPAPRNPRPAAKSRSWCGQERVQEPSSENTMGRKMIRPGISQMAEMAPSRVRSSYFRAGHDHWRKESTSQEASEPPRLKCQQPTYWRRGSLEPVDGRGSGQQPSSCSADTSNFKGSLYTVAARLSTTLLNNISWSPPLAKPQHSAPNLSLRGSDPTLLPKVADPHIREDSIEVHASLKRDLQPPGHCCARAALSKTESLQGLGEPENPNGAPQKPPSSKKSGFLKRLRCFLLQHCFRK
ncbi:PREDICTED: uncharacterized protein C22orf46 homolog isoform X1 [Hipposideros armiger]|uniref:Uncharacterized protein C22orf46 homolog isoform X1 n=2 Tax=Hipposideros armiger TaxID=186990 RepID=A0A8B7QKX8_HIPAR|nr:PREDICTED: uncharacterized protein C22orf46 homolog isoform X1 [Hipposideros armiger]